jgi:hypothetical protein
MGTQVEGRRSPRRHVSRSHAWTLCPSMLPACRLIPSRGRPSYSPLALLSAARWAPSHYKIGTARRAPGAPAVHGPSRPPAPLEPAAASSRFRPAAHTTETPSTFPCTYYSSSARLFFPRSCYLAGAKLLAAAAAWCRCPPPPAGS